jgi:hypothetical protein
MGETKREKEEMEMLYVKSTKTAYLAKIVGREIGTSMNFDS